MNGEDARQETVEAIVLQAETAVPVYVHFSAAQVQLVRLGAAARVKKPKHESRNAHTRQRRGPNPTTTKDEGKQT